MKQANGRAAPGRTALGSEYLVAACALAAIIFPYGLAILFSGRDYVFGGFLINPLDGNSYLAKMMEGWQGAWRFTLPYTPQTSPGAFVFLLYIALGHFARIAQVSPLLVYHIARLASAVFLLFSLLRFYRFTLPAPRQQRLAFAIAALGSGAGWLALPTGAVTSDFWVAEAYPFLSAFTNPHFPLGLGLLLWALVDGARMLAGGRKAGWVRLALVSLGIAIVAPFGVVVLLVVLGGLAAWQLIEQWSSARELPARLLVKASYPLLVVIAGGGLYLAYQYWAIHADPLLAAWDAQNQTPSPPLWDLALSFAPVLLLALAGLIGGLDKRGAGARLLIVWAALGLALLYIPFSLQRRFIMGLYVPLAGLSVPGIYAIGGWLSRTFRQDEAHARSLPGWLKALIFVLVFLPTNLIFLLGSWQGIRTHDQQVYLTRGEAQALRWILESTPPGAMILAAPETGRFIPAWTGRRVLYGHPFETVQAAEREKQVLGYFQGNEVAQGVSAGADGTVDFDYVFFGPRERQLGSLPGWLPLKPVYQGGGITIFEVGP